MSSANGRPENKLLSKIIACIESRTKALQAKLDSSGRSEKKRIKFVIGGVSPCENQMVGK